MLEQLIFKKRGWEGGWWGMVKCGNYEITTKMDNGEEEERWIITIG